MKRWLILVPTIALGAILRLYRLGEIPHGLAWDEASIIYNSWALSLWHRDEFANFLPLVFKSFGDYKAPFMFYALAIPYKLFGLHEVWLRGLSALAGIALIIVVYFLAKELFVFTKKSQNIALLSALLTAISPWSIHFSRLGFESNTAVLFTSLGTLGLLKGEKKSIWWLIATISFAISLYTFQTTRIFAPVILAGYLTIKWSRVKKSIPTLLLSGIVLIASIIPVAYATYTAGAGERGKQTLIVFTNQDQFQPIGQIITEFLSNLSTYLSFSFWVDGYDAINIRHSVPGYGVLLRAEFILLLIGLVHAVRFKNKSTSFLLFWLFAGLLPSLLAHKSPHAVRTLLALPAPQLLAAFGAIKLQKLTKKYIPKVSQLTVPVVLALLFINLTTYLKTYYGSYAATSALAFQYGYKEAVDVIKQKADQKDKIIVTDAYEQPYIYILLYNRIPPQQFLFGALSKYEFRSINWPESRPNTLFVASPTEIPPTDPRVTQIITVPNSSEIAFIIAETPLNE